MSEMVCVQASRHLGDQENQLWALFTTVKTHPRKTFAQSHFPYFYNLLHPWQWKPKSANPHLLFSIKTWHILIITPMTLFRSLLRCLSSGWNLHASSSDVLCSVSIQWSFSQQRRTAIDCFADQCWAFKIHLCIYLQSKYNHDLSVLCGRAKKQ